MSQPRLLEAYNVPAPVFDGLGHGTLDWLLPEHSGGPLCHRAQPIE